MKRWIAAILMTVLLLEFFPADALASMIGEPLTEDELKAAYTLAGLDQENVSYHKGMAPSTAMNTRQLLLWLDEMISGDLYSVGRMLARTRSTLATLSQSNPEAFDRLTRQGQGAEMVARVEELQLAAEDLRQTLRFSQDRIKETASMIEVSANLMKDRQTYGYEALRYAQRIRVASADIKDMRQSIVDNAPQWRAQIAGWKGVCDGSYAGTSPVDQAMNDWMGEVFLAEGMLEEKTVSTTLSSTSTRMSRLTAGGSVLGEANASGTVVTVMTENEFGFVITGDKKALEGVKISVKDALKPDSEYVEKTTNSFGIATFDVADFTLNLNKLSLYVLIDATNAKGADAGKKYRSLNAGKLTVKKGQKLKYDLKVDDGSPYVYTGTFYERDIMTAEYQMLYADANDMPFDITVKIMNDNTKPTLHYEDKDGKELGHSDSTSNKDGVYTFTNTWKSIFKPGNKIYFTGKSGKKYTTMLTPIAGVFDEPTDLSSILEDLAGFGLSFPVPKLGDASLSIGVPEWLPKFYVDPLGSVSITIGTTNFLPEHYNNWKSNEVEDYKDAETVYANWIKELDLKGAAAVAKNGMRQNKYSCMAKGDMTLGVFVVLQGHWEDDPDVPTVTNISVDGTVGGLFSYTVNITQPFAIGPVPCYLNIEIGACISAAFNLQWDIVREKKTGKMVGSKFYFLRDFDIIFSLMLGVSVGAGVKDIASLWVKGSGSLTFAFGFYTNRSPSVVISAEAALSAGVTVFFVTFSLELVKGEWELYTTEKKKKYSLLAYYMEAARAEAKKENKQQSQEPQSYPDLVAEKNEEYPAINGATGKVLIRELEGDTYAFLIQEGRIHWYNLPKHIDGSIADCIGEGRYQDVDPSDNVKEMKDYAFDVMTITPTYNIPIWDREESRKINDCFAVVGVCAGEFDENHLPLDKPNNACVYALYLWRKSNGSLTWSVNGFDKVYESKYTYLGGCWRAQWMGEGGAVGFIGVDPQITGANYHLEVNEVEDVRETVNSDAEIDILLTQAQPAGSKEPPQTGSIHMNQQYHYDYAYGVRPETESETTDQNTYSDGDVVSSAGDDYTRVSTRYIADNIWVAVSRSGRGSGDKGAIEFYDRASMANAKKTLALTKGVIKSFALLPGDAVADGCTVFYVDDVSDEAGKDRFRMKSVGISDIKRSEDNNLTFDAIETTYDVDIGASVFKVAKMKNGLYVVYWLAAGHKSSKDKSDAYRVYYTCYDPTTNTMSDDAVFAEVSLPDKGMEMLDFYLSSDGTGYLLAGKESQESYGKQGAPNEPVSLYSFKSQLGPVVTLNSQSLEDLLVNPGDFDDFTITVMNSGNFPATTLDLKVFSKESSGDTVIGELHTDCLKPEDSYLKVNGKTVASGEKAFYRLEDYDLTPRQRDCLITEARTSYAVEGGEIKPPNPDKPKTEHVKTKTILQGTLASFKGAMLIPSDWKDGTKTIQLSLAGYKTWLNPMTVIAQAGGRGSGRRERNVEISYSRDDVTGLIMPATEGLTDEEAALLIRDKSSEERLSVSSLHDLDVSHRLYLDSAGEKQLSIIITNSANTSESIRLYAAVYVDDEKEPSYVNLPYYPDAMSNGMTHTIDLPLSALVNPKEHEKARMVIRGIDIEETSLVNNEFTLYLEGKKPLVIIRHPSDVTIWEGESASFSVEASGGVKPYRYQWQMWNAKKQQWADLSGATDSVLSRDNVKKKWNGAKFRCVVTDRAGTTVASDAATLTVRKNVDTGDHSNLPLYLAVAALALIALCVIRRRRRENRA